MAPDPGRGERLYTVSCAFSKAVPDGEHQAAIRDAVARVHRCTTAATELLNLYVRDRLENHAASGLDKLFEPNWLRNAYYAVAKLNRKSRADGDASLQAVYDTHMSDALKESRDGLTTTIYYECIFIPNGSTAFPDGF